MFQSTRNKLTAWYLLIIMVISGSFSFVIYRVLTREMDRFVTQQRFRIERRLPFSPAPSVVFLDLELIEDVKRRIKLFLVAVNGSILVIAGGLGYFLAGRTLKPISEMVDEQSRFVSDASHELKTPLTSLKSAFEVFLRDDKSSLIEAKLLIKESILEVNKLQNLSESLLQLSSYQNADKNIDMENVDLGEVLRLANKRVEPMAKHKGIGIEIEDKQVWVRGNRDYLVDLTVILLDNAIKYSGEKSNVWARTATTDKKGVIEVRDEGIGISKQDQDRIFDRFYRADSARSKNDKEGYGLGLSIAKKIIETHKGSVSIKSTLNKGSTFTVRLPKTYSS